MENKLTPEAKQLTKEVEPKYYEVNKGVNQVTGFKDSKSYLNMSNLNQDFQIIGMRSTKKCE